MQRDLDLVRLLLFYFEAKEDDVVEECPDIPGFAPLVIRYHMLLLAEADFISFEPTAKSSTGRLIGVCGFNLTWKGHEFLEAARDQQGWERAKSVIRKTTGGLMVDVLRALLTHKAKEALSILS